ncbi:unnamed protein product [Ilex paraguariensis]|uniref:Enoyl reductase (ER) domain-containing protein n=1 Tax=Ilex paraguariensis TaxID=185542 RepID=A0ABC8R7C3_9AQUA
MAAKLMQAVWYESYGGGVAGLKHVEVPVPAPNNDEVLLKLEATSLNPVDWKIQKGWLRLVSPRKLPFIPASDFAGEVVEVGNGVRSFKPGDKVVAVTFALGGGLAEYAVTKESLTVPRPPEVSAAEGAGLPIAALTAHQALTQVAGVKLDGSGSQKNILITAASGGVGHYAVQLAKLGNTHVTATCGARNIDLVKSLGADEVLDYKTPDGAALKSPSDQKYDAVIHCATGIPWSTFKPNLSANGKVIDLTPGLSTMWTVALNKLTFSKQQLVPLIVSPKKSNLDYLVKLVSEGKLKTLVDSKYPLSKAEDAWAKSIDGHATGKIIYAVTKESLTVPRPPEVSAAEGAGLPIAALTAHQALTQVAGVKLDGSGSQKNILITAASGGVGHYAVQLAKLGNTHVTATCGARNIDLVKSLGADEVLDYKTPDGAALKSPSDQKYDAVIHCATGIPWSTFKPNLSANGKVIDLTPGLSTMWTVALNKLTFSKQQLVPLIVSPKKSNLDYLVKLVSEGKLKTLVDSKYPLSKAEDAWAKSIDGHATGKIIVEP